MHKFLNTLKNEASKSVLALSVLILIIIFGGGIGCEKSPIIFSTNPVQPPENQINVDVYHGSYLQPSVLVKATDPLGNTFSTITDSNGVALFDPVPFNAGIWLLQIPSQPICGINVASQGLTVSHGVTSQTGSFRNPVKVNLNSYLSVISESSALFVIQAAVTVFTSNDCGTPWIINITPLYSSIQSWSNPQGINIDSGVTGTWNDIKNGSIANFTFAFKGGQSPQFTCSVSSYLGSGDSKVLFLGGQPTVWNF